MSEKEVYNELRLLTREHLRLTRGIAQLGGNLEDEDARLVKVLEEHPEYEDIWDRSDWLAGEEMTVEGVNPHLHVTIHTMIENQLAEAGPPAVSTTLRQLMKRGLSRHEAIHAIGSVLVEELFDVFKHERPFNERRYVRKLRRLPGKV